MLPDPVQPLYTESHSALISKLRVLAGIGMRAVVEAVCKHEAAAGKDLEKRIESLVEKGLIATEDGRILHSLRFMGNQAAHEDDELATAFAVVEPLLQGVYVIQRKAKRLPKKKTTPRKKTISK